MIDLLIKWHYAYSQVVAATSSGAVFRVNLSNLQQITISESHTGPVVALAFPSHSSEKLATASKDGTIRYRIALSSVCIILYSNCIINFGVLSFVLSGFGTLWSML